MRKDETTQCDGATPEIEGDLADTPCSEGGEYCAEDKFCSRLIDQDGYPYGLGRCIDGESCGNVVTLTDGREYTITCWHLWKSYKQI